MISVAERASITQDEGYGGVRVRSIKRLLAIVTALCLMPLSAAMASAGGDSFSGKVDVGGYGIYCELSAKDGPIVVFETGLTDAHDSELAPGVKANEPIGDEIAKVTGTFMYDRAGLGQSDARTIAPTLDAKVTELHNALERLEISSGIIFIAHSVGGYTARVYAAKYPGDVLGIVMLDCSSEQQLPIIEELVKPIMPAEVWDAYLQQFDCEGGYDAAKGWAAEVVAASTKDALRLVPLTVIYGTNHGMGDEMEATWAEWQEGYAGLSDDCKVIRLEGAGHYVQVDQPQVVIDEIKAMINKVRGGD